MHAAVSAAVLALGIWISSGTLAPYAATDARPIVAGSCGYLLNVDHCHLVAPFLMIAGADPGEWQYSVVLRRILYPLAAFPFVRAGGVMLGGLVANLVLTIAAQLAFAVWARRRFGDRAAIASLWLLATYPGITYWAGLPYSYAGLVPATLWAVTLLYRIDAADDARELAAASTMLGITFLAYDLFPFFLPAAVLLLLWRRRVRWAAIAAGCAIAPMLLLLLLFRAIVIDVVNSNTSVYGTIAASWLRPIPSSEWAAELARLPRVLFATYLSSNFLFLPLLFAAIALVARRKREWIGRPEVALLVAGAALFLFNNAAPPYRGWQMRGEWIARLYQPLFVVFLLVAARAAASRIGRVLIAATVVANAAIVAGPITMTPLGFYAYHRFYAHSPAEAFRENLLRHGRRPLGVCRETGSAWTGPVECP